VRSLARLGLLAVLGLLAAVAALEIGVRWLVPMSDEFFRPDGVAGVHHIAGRSGRWRSREFDVTVRINSHGFRDRERAHARPPGTRRVVVLGDSMTEAFQVPLDDTFTARVERRLNVAARAVEVLNLGITALGPAQEYLIYRAYGAPYAPDVVVLVVFMGNDIRGSSPDLEGKPYLRYPVVAQDGGLARDPAGAVMFTEPARPGRIRQWARTQLASYRFVRDRVVPAFGVATPTMASDDILAIYREPLAPAWRRAVDVTHAMIAELERAVREDGGRLLVALLPAPWDVDPAARTMVQGAPPASIDWRAAERRTETWLRAQGLATLPLAEAFAADIARGGRPYFAMDGHLTSHGHALMAEHLADAIGRAL
jgi:lysophospholipase L1-like esterase